MYPRVGDRVKFKGEYWFVVDGPVMGTEGSIYHLSKVAPPVRALGHELSPDDGGSDPPRTNP